VSRTHCPGLRHSLHYWFRGRRWLGLRTSEVLAEGLGTEAGEFVIFYDKADLNWFAAYLAVFDVGLAADGQVQHHRNVFSTIWTSKFVFHWIRRYCNRSGRTTEAAFGQCLINAVVSMGQRNTKLEPSLH
jgi:hypothetical protein